MAVADRDVVGFPLDGTLKNPVICIIDECLDRLFGLYEFARKYCRLKASAISVPPL